MWTRADLKERGKLCFHRNYAASVLAGLMITIATASIGGEYDVRGTVNSVKNDSSYSADISLPIVGGVTLFTLILKIFVLNVLMVGAVRFFIENRDYNAPVSKIGFGFQNGNFSNVVLVMFMQNLYIFLWTLLLVIPGIVKSYSYRMVPYILAEQPDINYRDAIRISREMMDGEKMNTFVLDLSFILWGLLGAVTCGLGVVFYVKPYVEATNAELYVTLRNKWNMGNTKTATFDF